MGHQSLARDHQSYGDMTEADSSARTLLFLNTMPSPFPALTAEPLPTLMRCARSLNAPWVVEHECITQLPPSTRA